MRIVKCLQIIVYHSESRSLFYVVDTDASESEQPCVVETFTMREQAIAYVSESLHFAARHEEEL